MSEAIAISESLETSYDITKSSLHHIDLESGNVLEKSVQAADISEYLQDLINTILKRDDNRRFTYSSDTTEVISAIYQCIDNKNSFDNAAQIISDRLLRSEIETNITYKVSDIKKGSLIQALLEYEDNYFYVITKVEHSAFIDGSDLTKHMGLPFEKRTLKTCIIQMVDNDIVDIRIHDSNSKISTYWWKTFLELKELNSNEKNTTMALNHYEKMLISNVSKKSLVDYTLLRNNLIGYFRTQTTFNIEQLIDSVFGAYEPEDPNLVDMKKVKELAKELPRKKEFDPSFEIVPSCVDKRKKYNVKINDNVYLNIRDHLSSLKRIIKSRMIDGEKYIIIKTDNEIAFKKFNYKDGDC